MSKNVYENSKIYKIVDNAYTEQYIGSTTVGLSTRMTKHRVAYRSRSQANKRYCSSFILFDKYGLENCKIELIEDYSCGSITELRKREGYWIKAEDCVNKQIAGRTKLEYATEHKKDKSKYDKDYREKHRETLIQKSKQYYENHRQDKQEYDKIRYAKVKDILSERLTCEVCGYTYTVWHKKRHERSQRHINALELINN